MDRMTPSIVSIEQIGVSVKIPDLFRTVFRLGHSSPLQRIADSYLPVTNGVSKFVVFDFFRQAPSAETHSALCLEPIVDRFLKDHYLAPWGC